MFDRKKLDINKYLVVGPENTNGRAVKDIVTSAVKAGFTIVQIRSKVVSARELIELTRGAADAIAECGKSDSVALVVDDRLDVVLAARDMGIKVDGIHVGQSDIPVSICRKYLGENAIVGLSAEHSALLDFIRTSDTKDVDYFGAGPMHATETKKDLETDENDNVIYLNPADFSALAAESKIPVTVGGGVKANDIPILARNGLGFFVVSAVAGAPDPYKAAKELVDLWNANSENS